MCSGPGLRIATFAPHLRAVMLSNRALTLNGAKAGGVESLP